MNINIGIYLCIEVFTEVTGESGQCIDGFFSLKSRKESNFIKIKDLHNISIR